MSDVLHKLSGKGLGIEVTRMRQTYIFNASILFPYRVAAFVLVYK